MKKFNKKIFFVLIFLLYVAALLVYVTLPKKPRSNLSSAYDSVYTSYQKNFPKSAAMPGVQAGANQLKLLVNKKFSTLGLFQSVSTYEDSSKHLEIPAQYDQPVRATRDGYWVEFTPQFKGGVKGISAEVTENTLIYPSVAQDLDIVEHVMPYGLKEDMILRSKNAPSSFTWKMRYDSRLTPVLENNTVSFYASVPKKMKLENGNQPAQSSDQFDSVKKFEISPPFLMDKKGVIHLKVQTAIDKGNITFTIEKDWLAREATYPLLLDPTILYNTSAGFSSGAYTRAADEGLGNNPAITTGLHQLSADQTTSVLWHMNEASGNLIDSSGNGNTGVVTGTGITSGPTTSAFGNARSFNGTTDVVNITNSFGQPQKMTIEFWFKTATTTISGLFYVGDQPSTGTPSSHVPVIVMNANGTIRAEYWNGAVGAITTPTAYNDNKWHHVAFVTDVFNQTLYMDGQFIGSRTGTTSQYWWVYTTLGSGYVTTTRGAAANAWYYFNGSIDEFRLSTSARSADEIRLDAQRYPYSVYTSPAIDLGGVGSWTNLNWIARGVRTGSGETPVTTDGLVAEWNFNEASGTTASNAAPATGTAWSTGLAGGTGRDRIAGVTYNGKIYYWAGWNSLNTIMDIYDIAGNSWTTGASGGTARYDNTGVLYNGKIYYWGGTQGSNYLNTVDIYNIATNSWSIGTAGGTGRRDHTAVLWGSKIYYWGGTSAGGIINTVDIYDCNTDTWSTGTAGGTGRYDHSYVVANGRIYNWGGYSSTTLLNTMDIYDINNGMWIIGTAGGTARYMHQAVLFNGKMYNWGGSNGGGDINTTDIYDIVSNTWSFGLTGGTAREEFAMTINNGIVYIWGGFNNGMLNTMDIYNLGTSGCGSSCNATLTNFVPAASGGRDGWSPGMDGGGTITFSGNYAIHTFTASGTFTVNTAKNVEVLVVGAGGAGGVGVATAFEAGGGGAGGVVYNSAYAVSPGAYTVTVGNGVANANGQNSIFGTITAVGGGKGAAGPSVAGNPGGSGGGGTHPGSMGGAGTAGQGNAGGMGGSSMGGGGGGAAQAGNVPGQGKGGNGTAYTISGASVYYGGGGGAYPGITGGLGGGGTSTTTVNGAVGSGTANTGGGGAGAYCNNGACAAGVGGSGIVIIRYPVLPSGWTANSRWGAGALMFDGNTDSVEVANNGYLSIGGPITVSAWVNVNSYTQNAWILGKGSGSDGTGKSYEMYITPNTGLLVFRLHNGATYTNAISNVSVPVGTWTHVVGTWNGTTMYVYINGVQVGSAAFAGPLRTGAEPLVIGRRISGGAYQAGCNFAGTMDTVKLYNRYMSAAEVQSDYQAGQLELQTRTSTDNITWEAWKPYSNENTLDNMDAPYLYNTTDSNLVSYWPMDEMSGTAVADVKSGLNGTVNGTAPIVDGGVYGNAKNFNGGYVSVPDNANLDITGNFTISAWVNKTTSGNQTIVSKTGASGTGGFGLLVGNAGEVYCRTDTGSGFTDSYTDYVGYVSPAAGLVHVAAVRNGTSCRIYINGIDRTLTDNPHAANGVNALPLNIGVRGDYAMEYWNGTIDEVRLYNTNLTATQVQQLYQQGFMSHSGSIRSVRDTALQSEGTASLRIDTGRIAADGKTLALWHLNETGGTGAYLRDATGNGFNLTPTNTTVVNGISGKGRNVNGGYLNIGSYITGATSNITAEFWVNIPTTSQACGLLYFGPGIGIGVGSGVFDNAAGNYGNKIILLYEGVRWIDTGQTYGTGWHHIGVVLNASGVPFVYYDGRLLQGFYGAGPSYANSNTYIGMSGARACTQNNIMDEVKISSVARTSSEIADDYRNGRDTYVNKPILNSNLSGSTTLPFYVAGMRPGTYATATVGNSAYANYQPDTNTLAMWHMNEGFVAGGEMVQNTSGLVGLYHMNEASGNLVDSSGTGNAGTVTGTTVVASQNGMNSARYFDGTTGFADLGTTGVGNSLQITGSQTIEMWLYPTDFSQRRNPFAKAYGGEGTITQETNGTLTYFYGTAGGNTTPYTGFSSNVAIPLNTWSHVAVVRDLTAMTVVWYINGQVVSSAAAPYAAAVASALNAYIGKGYVSNYAGNIDEFRIYNRALSALDIARDATYPVSGFKDSSGNGYDANTAMNVYGNYTQGPTGFGKAHTFGLNTTDSVAFPDIALGTNYTIDAWINFPIAVGTNWKTLFANNGGTYHYALVLNGGTTLGVYNAAWYPCGFDANSISGWHHLAEVVNSGVTYTQFYLDGLPICKSPTQITNHNIGIIGNYTTGGGIQGAGTSIDEVRISNVARSASDIYQAAQIGARTHNITIDFAARLDAGDLISNSTDYNFTVDGTYYGLSTKGSNIGIGDKIIVRENYNGTEYFAQGTVTSANVSTGAIVVSGWDAGSTFPAGGFTVNADVFKWQREFWNLTTPTAGSVNSVPLITYHIVDGSVGNSLWIDDLRANSGYINSFTPVSFDVISGTGTYTVTPGITSTRNRYFQYRLVNDSADYDVAPQATSVSMNYVQNYAPNAPTISMPTNGAVSQSITPTIQMSGTDPEGNYLQYKIQIATDAGFSSIVQTIDETSSQTGWTGQNAGGGTAYNPGSTATYTVQTPLTGNTTYYIRAYAYDPAGSSSWSSASTAVSFTTNYKPNAPAITVPITGATGLSRTPVFQMSGTDPESDFLRYKVQIATDAGFSSIVQTIDQTVSQTGWAGQNTQGGTAYTSGTTASYTVQSALTGNTTYYLRAYSIDQGGSIVWSNASATVSFTTSYKPAAPTISVPLNGATGQMLKPVVQMAATDAEGDYLRYKLQLATDAGFTQNLQTFDETVTQTGWTGQNTQGNTAYTSGATATYTIQANLNPGTLYYLRAYAVDPGGSAVWSNASGTVSFTTNYTPNTPGIQSPVNGATNVVVKPTIAILTTDNDTDYLRYKIQLATDAGFTLNLQTFDQTLSQTGWTGQNAQGGTAYNSGTWATYTVQTALSIGTTYYIRAYAIDPGGTNGWSAASTAFNFTTGTLNAPSPCSASLLGNIGPMNVSWADTNVIEDNYLVEVSINSGAFNQISSFAAGTTSSQYGSLAPLTSYQYRIRGATADGQYGGYCTTQTVSTFTYGDLLFNQVMFNQIKMY